MNPGLFPWVVRRSNRVPAFSDGVRELLVRLWMLAAPGAQKCDHVIRSVSLRRKGDDARNRQPRFQQDRRLTARLNVIYDGWQRPRGILNS